MYKHSKVSFDNILATMHQEIHDFTNQASRHLFNKYKHRSFDRIAQDHPFMDVTPFVSNVIQNMCTFDTLLTSHQLGWTVVPLQILMVPILMEATAMPCHLEFVQYLTKWPLHVQQSIWVSNTTPAPVPAPAPHPVGVNLESLQENPGSSRPKTSDPDSPEICPDRPAPHSDSPDTPSKPPVTLTKPDAMPSKTPNATPSKTSGATPTKPPVMPSTSLDPSLGPLAMPRKCTLMPQKAVPSGSGNSAKDILDRVTARYGAGMSPQYSNVLDLNVLALLTSGKSSQVVAPKHPDPDTPASGGHPNQPPMSNWQGVTAILIARRWNLPTRGQNIIPVVDWRSLMPGPVAPRRNLPRRLPRKCQSPRGQSRLTPTAGNLKTCVGSSALSPLRKRLRNANAGMLINGHLTCQVCNPISSGKGSSRIIHLPMTLRTIPIIFNKCYATMSPLG